MDRLRLARIAARVLAIGGVIAGSSREVIPVQVLRHGDEVVLSADLHVHGFPGDGTLPPWDLSREAARRGLDAIALTSHNNQLAWWLAGVMPSPAGSVLVIQGQELTAAGYHMASIGTDGIVDWRQSAASAARAIHARGGIAIAAHPAGRELKGFDAAAIAELDGYEAAHPLIFSFEEGRRDVREFGQRARALKPGIAAIGSTDFHFFAPLGFCRTFVFARERSASAIIDAIRRGRTVACDAAGEVYGPPELTPVVLGACRAVAGSPARDASSVGRVGAALLWTGLVAMTLLGASEAR